MLEYLRESITIVEDHLLSADLDELRNMGYWSVEGASRLKKLREKKVLTEDVTESCGGERMTPDGA